MKYLTPVFLSMVAFGAPAVAEETREADAHEHGHGTFNLAIEGDVVAIELETPSFDLLGFEYEAKSYAEKKAVENARKALADPIALFGLPKAATCHVDEAEIEIGADETHHDEDEHRDEHAEDKHDDDHHDDAKDHDDHHDEDEHDAHEEEPTHSEVHAHYTLTCDAPDKVDSVNMTNFFKTFPNAEELDAAILTDAGQTSGELEPDSPELSF